MYFVTFTFIFLVVGGVILHLKSKMRGDDKWWTQILLEDNWFWLLILATIVAGSIVAYKGGGPARLLPKDIPTEEQRETVWGVFKHIAVGTNTPAKIAKLEPLPKVTKSWWLFGKLTTNYPPVMVEAPKPLPWTTGSWAYFNTFLAFFFFTPVFGCWAYHDNVIRFFERKRKEKEESDKHEKKDGGEHHQRSFFRPDFWDLFGIFEFLARTFKSWRKEAEIL